MTELLFIRHAATDMAGTFCGHSDPPLNALGKQQTEALIRALTPQTFDCIYTSDLQRATATAHALAESFEIPVFESAALREISFGEWEGLSWSQIEQRDPQYARSWAEDFPNVPAPGGETYADFQMRVHREVYRLSRCSSGKRIAVVTHAGVMRSVLTTAHGCTPQEAWDRTCNYCSTFLHTLHTTLQEVPQ